jgi:hypothetical protein
LWLLVKWIKGRVVYWFLRRPVEAQVVVSHIKYDNNNNTCNNVFFFVHIFFHYLFVYCPDDDILTNYIRTLKELQITHLTWGFFYVPMPTVILGLCLSESYRIDPWFSFLNAERYRFDADVIRTHGLPLARQLCHHRSLKWCIKCLIYICTRAV